MAKEDTAIAGIGCMTILLFLAIRLGIIGFVMWLLYTLVMWMVAQ